MTKPPRKCHKKPPKAGPYSRHLTGRLADQRTAEAKTFNEILAALTDWMGGEPDTAQMMILQQAALHWLRLTLVADSVIDTAKLGSDGHHVLAWSANLRRHLQALGLRPMQPPPSVTSHLRVGIGTEPKGSALERIEAKLAGIRARLAPHDMAPAMTAEQASELASLFQRGLDGDKAAAERVRDMLAEAAGGREDGDCGAMHPDALSAGEAAPVTDVTPIPEAEPTEHEPPASGAEKPSAPGVVERLRRALGEGEDMVEPVNTSHNQARAPTPAAISAASSEENSDDE